MCQKLEFRHARKGEIIFRQGDVGDYFYILIHGKVQLHLPNVEIDVVKKKIAELQIDLVHSMRKNEFETEKEQ